MGSIPITRSNLLWRFPHAESHAARGSVFYTGKSSYTIYSR